MYFHTYQDIELRLGAQSDALLSTYFEGSNAVKTNVNAQLDNNSPFCTCFWEVDHPLCDVWKQKTQILIAHQKEDIERTQKSTATRQKKFG